MFTKVYNINSVKQLVYSIAPTLEISKEEIKSGKTFKKLKNYFLNIENAKSLYNITDDKEELIKKFFPNKYEEVSQGDYHTLKFFFRKEDGKIVWAVNHEGNERVFKLKTDTYKEKIKETLNKILKRIRSDLDVYNGYWIYYENDRNWYITDMNMENGSYKRLATYSDNYTTYHKHLKKETLKKIKSLVSYIREEGI